ncbi:PE-PPE domain-containing protein [Mycobacterium sp. CVI_P3]|uniref:PE-PPE domain-containing protein n=1 Tax=Mycobacterium pinniadriaticum TaxID=2994102 RepID=A0ABT3SGZ9_9MYCO|nr:PE-PPE domain-containing protein [Mycobacterium pinniadriaticum]MCX2932248.1 PE-PPE domain-containing protein [Mycobacterium pinniadriaticum]MCX2938652.1 PE-PPE domain-containing protein [Mycobacterium pinniadriaticum]
MIKQTGLAAMMSAALIATAPISNAATVLTLEGGLVGLQHIWHFTPTQLQGDLCKSPNHCQPVDYFAFPGGAFTDQGAAKVMQAIDALPDDEQIVLFGHSQGGQVVYSDLRRFAADPASAPDPSRLSWVSIGNPENSYGGRRGKTESATDPWLPPDTAYQGIEVIRQYDGWADWPDDPRNLLAVANAVAGMFSIHTNYRNIDLDDPNNVRYTPEVAGQPGNVTYVWVPTPVMPLAAWAGPLAPALDNALRPIVERAYHRPVDIPDPTPPSSASVQPARSSVAAPRSTGTSKRATTHRAKPASQRKAKGSTASSARRK